MNKYMLKGIKAKKQVKRNAKKEAEQIFKKVYPELAMKDGTFPKSSPSMPRKYNKAARKTERMVVKGRVKQYKKNK